MSSLDFSLLENRKWRLSNLYYIKDKGGNKILFKPNWAQIELMSPHYLNIILKARQLGVTTYHAIMFLDTCLFNRDVNAAIIADNKPNSREIFIDKVKYAYDNLPEYIQEFVQAKRDNVNELRFNNGSVFRVGTSLRSGTLQLLHVTEFAKIATDNPKKASEIVSGAINTIQAGQFCCIESTARGRDGYFYNMCKTAMNAQIENTHLTKLDWKFWFFPWWKEPEYVLESDKVVITKEKAAYFDKIEKECNTIITPDQRAWYVKKEDTQGEYMMREYPSTPDEAFNSANEGLLFGRGMAKVRAENRICHLPHDDNAITYACFDIGIGDDTAIWIFQVVGKEVHFIDYYENNNEAAAFYVNWIKKLPYHVEKLFLPHDAAHREKGSGKTYALIMQELGMKVAIVQRDANEFLGIDAARNAFPRFWFDKTKCVKGIKALDNFKKEWNEKLSCYREKSLHDWASHAAKSLIYGVKAINTMLTNKGPSSEDWKRMRNAAAV